MLVATPGQTTAYSTLHNSGNTATAKKSTLTSNTNASAASTAVGTPKSLINNNHNSSTTSSTNNSYSQHQHHQIHKNDSKNNNTTTSTSKDLNSTKTATHSVKAENSTKPINFIQTLKDSVQKALISTTGICSLATNKHNSDNKLQNCNNSNTTTTTSLSNVTSSSSSNNIAKAAATTSAAIATNVAATASTSSFSLVRNKYSSCSLSKLHTIAPTNLHRYPEDRQQASSTDSLQKEMCHFKPIRTAPTTPWKRSVIFFFKRIIKQIWNYIFFQDFGRSFSNTGPTLNQVKKNNVVIFLRQNYSNITLNVPKQLVGFLCQNAIITIT